MLPFGVTDEQITEVLLFRRRLVKEQLIDILTDYEKGVSFRKLSKIYGVNRWTIADIFELLHVPIRTNLCHQCKPKLLSKQQRKEAALRVHHGEKITSVVRSYGVAKLSNFYRVSGQIINTLVEELNLPVPERYLTDPTSTERLNQIYKAWKGGMSVHRVARKFHSDPEKIKYILHKCGAKFSSRPWKQRTDEDRKWAVEEFNKGATVSDLSAILKCAPYHIIKWLRLDVGTATHYDRWIVMQNLDKDGMKPGTRFPNVVHTRAGLLRRKCQELTEETIDEVRRIALEGESQRDRLKAIEMIWDRGWGKPKEVSDDEDATSTQQSRVLSMVSSKLQQTIKLTTLEEKVVQAQPQLEDLTEPEPLEALDARNPVEASVLETPGIRGDREPKG